MMKKSLVALAALAAVGAASAQSSVTLSGIMKSGVSNTKYSGGAAGNGTGWALNDGSSRFIMSGREDLGGGLAAVFQIDTRFRIDDNGGAPASSPLAAGNTFVGLAGGFGSLRVGKLDTHYCLGSDSHGVRATALAASSCALLGNAPSGAALANTAIANASRSTNIVNYTSPNMGGLVGQFAYTFSNAGAGSEGAVGDPGKGRGYNLRADYANGPLNVGASYWNNRSESRATGAAFSDQKAFTIAGGFNFGVATVGLTLDQSQITTGTIGGASTPYKRRTYSVPLTVPLGSGTLLATYTRARDVSGFANTGANLTSVGYEYSLSRRTSLGVSYARLTNKAAASYQLYTQTALGGHVAATAGQDQSQLYFGVRHTF